jgi:CheY-like chemotaxis protein
MQPAAPPARRLHVLLAEDNAVNQRLAQSLLQRRGRLADLEVDFGERTTARIRHLDEQTAQAAWEALSAELR